VVPEMERLAVPPLVRGAERGHVCLAAGATGQGLPGSLSGSAFAGPGSVALPKETTRPSRAIMVLRTQKILRTRCELRCAGSVRPWCRCVCASGELACVRIDSLLGCCLWGDASA
jgi:hypothetical protein